MEYGDRIVNEYFEWMFDLVCGMRYPESTSYRKLFMHLHNTEFIYIVPRDINRAKDGADLRRRFALSTIYEDALEYLDGPASVLEMMIALSIRCEENIMDDPSIGDRTAQWFWGMLTNLGLSYMTDELYDKEKAIYILDRFLYREYEPDGEGGLFTVKNYERDLREIEIWIQLCWYLDNIV